MGALPPDQASLGSAINDATRQVGAALGVAVQGTVLNQTATHHLRDHAPAGQAPTAAIERVTDLTAGPQPPELLDLARDAFCSGLTRAALVAAAAAAIGAALAWRKLPAHAIRAAPRTRPRRRRRSPRLLVRAAGAYRAAVMANPTRPEAWRVPSPDGRYGQADGPALNLLLLGDSLAVSVGVRRREDTVGALIATHLAQHHQAVILRVAARSGATAWSLRAQQPHLPQPPGTALIVVGGNDVTLPVSLSRSARRLGQHAAQLRQDGWTVIAATCPDYAVSPGLRPWIRATIVRRSQRLAALQDTAVRQAGGHVIHPSYDQFIARPTELFSEDGSHPSPQGYAALVSQSLPAVIAASHTREHRSR
ncbi:GDSL-type esterase/lipase family protein [Streptomyces sp. NPDC051577]|uniref:GDSL-type esterase/lipase family protein n=1 Tax=Streptomyces sp. NPDC051577 TaxID=3155166 RepID=UPI0034319ADF